MPHGLNVNLWMGPEVAGLFRQYIAKRRTVMFTRTCPARKSQCGEKAIAGRKIRPPHRSPLQGNTWPSKGALAKIYFNYDMRPSEQRLVF
jgi:hypothetical protein